jgi:hypothetical protein
MKHRYPVAVASIIAVVVTLLVTRVGVPFALILGGSAILAFLVWLLTTYRYPVDGRRILPLYVLAVGMQYVHMTEEFLAGFPVHFSALTGADLTPDKFVVVALLGGGMAYAFSGFGLVHRNPLANYGLWFFLIGPAGLVNSIAHVSFPFHGRRALLPGAGHRRPADRLRHGAGGPYPRGRPAGAPAVDGPVDGPVDGSVDGRRNLAR